MTDELDDLIGGTSDPRAERRARNAERATKLESERAREEAIKNGGRGVTFVDAGELLKPVSQNFLAIVFGMDPATVKKRLTRCKPLGVAGGQRPVYDFKEACGFLIKPRMTPEEFVKTLNHAHLPNEVNKAFWEARRIKLKYEIEAGDAWATGDVLEVFGDVFMTIKDRMQLWVETMREHGKLSDEQLARLGQMVDGLQNDMHQELMDKPVQRKTRSKLYEIDDDMPVTVFDDEGDE